MKKTVFVALTATCLVLLCASATPLARRSSHAIQASEGRAQAPEIRVGINHEFSDPEASMAAVRRSLKPGGRVFILEFARENRSAPASSLHKMSLEEIRAEIEPLGFELDRLLDFPKLQHGLMFKRRPSP